MIKSAAFLSLSRAWSQVTGAVLLVATAAVVNPTDLGHFVIAASIYGALAVFVGNGVYEYVMKEHDSQSAPVAAFFVNIVSAALAASVAVGISFVLPLLLHDHITSKLLRLLAPAFFLQGLVLLMESVVLRQGRIDRVAVALISAETLGLATALIGLATGLGVLALVIHRVCREATLVAVYGVSRRWKPSLAFDPSEAMTIVRFMRSIILSRALGMGTTATVDVVIGTALSAADAGLFRLANRLLSFAGDLLFQPFRALLWVQLPPLKSDLKAFGEKTFRLTEIYGVGLFAVIWGTALTVGTLLPLLLGPEWQGVVPAVIALALARLIGTPISSAEAVFALHNRTDLIVASSIITAVANIVAILLAAPFGLLWSGLAFAAVALFIQIYLLPYIVRICDLKLSTFAGLMARLTANGLVMTAIVAPWIAIGPSLQVTGWALAVSAVASGAGAYILAARRFTPDGYYAYMAPLVESLGRVMRSCRPRQFRGTKEAAAP